jgi:cell division protein FtsW (lipid II flippase)
LRSWNRICAVVLLVVAAVVIQQSLWVLRVFDHGQPGSGFMPFGLGILLGLLALGLLVTSRGHDPERRPFWQGKAWLQPLVAIAITAVFIVVFDDIGVLTSVTVLVFGWMWLVGRKSLLVAATTGLLTAAAVHLVFTRLLQAPFPKGLLF